MLLPHIWSLTFYPVVGATTQDLAAHECREFAKCLITRYLNLNMLISHIWSVTSYPAVAASAQSLAAHECREWRTMGLANPRDRTRPNSLGHRVATNVRRQHFREMTWSVLCENQRAIEPKKIWILTQGFVEQKLKKYSWNLFLFYDKKLQFTYP
jgi:hypothetical protein